MTVHSDEFSTIDCQINAVGGVGQLRRVHVNQSLHHRIKPDADLWLDLALSPRQGAPRVRYTDREMRTSEPIGDLFLLRGNESIIGSTNPMKCTSIVCKIDHDIQRRWAIDIDDWTDRQLVSVLDIDDENIRSLMWRLGRELKEPGFASEFMVELIVGQLALEIERFRTSNAIDLPTTGGLAPWQMRLIDEQINDANGTLTLDELASLCRISVRHLSRGFKETKGRSVGQYIADKRMSEAKRMLLEGENIKMIASRVGFRSISSFSTAFKKAVGVPPAKFRDSTL